MRNTATSCWSKTIESYAFYQLFGIDIDITTICHSLFSTQMKLRASVCVFVVVICWVLSKFALSWGGWFLEGRYTARLIQYMRRGVPVDSVNYCLNTKVVFCVN